MKRYIVMYRENEDWEDEFYPEPYIEADSKEEAIDIARMFVAECGYDPDDYDWMAEEAD